MTSAQHLHDLKDNVSLSHTVSQTERYILDSKRNVGSWSYLGFQAPDPVQYNFPGAFCHDWLIKKIMEFKALDCEHFIMPQGKLSSRDIFPFFTKSMIFKGYPPHLGKLCKPVTSFQHSCWGIKTRLGPINSCNTILKVMLVLVILCPWLFVHVALN